MYKEYLVVGGMPQAVNVYAETKDFNREIYDCPYAIQVSAKNFGFGNQIKSIPLYAMFCLKV